MAGSILQNPFAKPTQQQQPQNQQALPAGQLPNPNQLQSNIIPPEDDPIGNVSGTPKLGDDPMMDFKSLWENTPDDPKNPTVPEETNFLPKIDPAKIAETLSRIDFSKFATPEESAAITAGGEGATKAHSSILNKSLRQSMMTMFNVSQRMVEQGLTNAEGRFLGKVPSHVKDVMIESDLTASDPQYMSNPAFAPLVESTRQRYQEKFPKATPVQISSAVKAYLQEFVKVGSKKAETTPEDNAQKLSKGSADAEWDKWIEAELNKSL